MNEILKSLYERKSVRAFTDEPVTEGEKQLILKAAAEAPTAGNMSLYSIIDVQDQHLKEILAERCDHQPFIAKAPMVLVFLIDWQKWTDLFSFYGMPVEKLEESDLLLAAEDCMAAAQNAVIAAWSLGIGSCYIGDILEHAEDTISMFHLPEHVIPFAMLVFGHPTEQQKRRNKPLHFTVEDLVHVNGYHRPSEEELLARFSHHSQCEGEDLARWAEAFAKRKFFCDFRAEMNRSCRAMIRRWLAH